MNHLFISYAHLDDVPIEREGGWVTNFQTVLQIRLSQLLGEKAKVFFDPELRHNEDLWPTLRIQLNDVELLVAIVSPSYLNSAWCRREADEFRKALGQRGVSLSVGHRSRVYKIIKTRPDDQRHEFTTGPGVYEFYAYDNIKKAYYEFSDLREPNRDRRYWLMLEDLALDISKLLKTLSGPVSQPQSLVSPKTVYLAEVARDLKSEYNQMRRELESMDCYVVPDQSLPRKKSDFVTAVKGYLGHSRLSIHLLGQEEGDLVEGDHGESIVVWQNKLAAEMSWSVALPRVIWTPAETGTVGPLRQFIERLEEDEVAQQGADLLLRKPFDELKEVTRRKLQISASAILENQITVREFKTVYLIFDKQDVDQIPPITKYLNDRGLQVSLPLLDDKNPNPIKEHKRKLEECDGVLVYYGNGSQLWLENNLQILDNATGGKRTGPLHTNRSQPPACRTILIADPPTVHKKLFTRQKIGLVNAFGDFDPNRLDEFIDCVKGT